VARTMGTPIEDAGARRLHEDCLLSVGSAGAAAQLELLVDLGMHLHSCSRSRSE
jgi:hypothetical protein